MSGSLVLSQKVGGVKSPSLTLWVCFAKGCFVPKAPTVAVSTLLTSLGTCHTAWYPVFRIHEHDRSSQLPHTRYRHFGAQRTHVELRPQSESKKRNPRKQEQKPPHSPVVSEMTLIHTSYRAWGEWVPQSSFLNLEIPREE